MTCTDCRGGTLDVLASRIRKNPNYTLIIDWDEAGSKGVELACAVKEETELPIVVFQRNWTRDDLLQSFYSWASTSSFQVPFLLMTCLPNYKRSKKPDKVHRALKVN